jgi:hypothetical protein
LQESLKSASNDADAEAAAATAARTEAKEAAAALAAKTEELVRLMCVVFSSLFLLFLGFLSCCFVLFCYLVLLFAPKQKRRRRR